MRKWWAGKSDWFGERVLEVGDVLFPCRCRLCRAWAPSAGVPGLCGPCEQLLPWLPAREQVLCSSPLRAVVAAVSYEDPVVQLIYAVKYGGQRWAATSLASLLAESGAAAGVPDTLDALVPVPSYWTKRWARGGEPTAWLADELGRRWRIPVFPRALRRIRSTPALGQFGASSQRREQVLKGAFRATGHVNLLRARIGIVDDIWTTGTTVRLGAEALLASGTGPVTALVVAQAGAVC